MKSKCDWHKKDKPLADDEDALCPNCGKMLNTEICEGCNQEFLDWRSDVFDDICEPPSVFNGDLMCRSCARLGYEHEQQEIDDEAHYQDLPDEAFQE